MKTWQFIVLATLSLGAIGFMVWHHLKDQKQKSELAAAIFGEVPDTTSMDDLDPATNG